MIPTAKEWLEHFKENAYPGTSTSECMIEFAKLHVEAALKEASKKVEIHSDLGSNYHREFEEGIRNRTIWVPSNSIINAYSLTNII